MWKNGRHPNMPRDQRAKQFMPFAAVRGLAEALAERERIVDGRTELGEDRLSELDAVLRSLSQGEHVRIEHCRDGRYTAEEHVFFSVDTLTRELITDRGERISLDDIRSLENMQVDVNKYSQIEEES